jgi:pentatricopeptide repeat protein
MEPGFLTWHALVCGAARADRADTALSLYVEMRSLGHPPRSRSGSELITSLSLAGRIVGALLVLQDMRQCALARMANLEPLVIVAAAPAKGQDSASVNQAALSVLQAPDGGSVTDAGIVGGPERALDGSPEQDLRGATAGELVCSDAEAQWEQAGSISPSWGAGGVADAWQIEAEQHLGLERSTQLAATSSTRRMTASTLHSKDVPADMDTLRVEAGRDNEEPVCEPVCEKAHTAASGPLAAAAIWRRSHETLDSEKLSTQHMAPGLQSSIAGAGEEAGNPGVPSSRQLASSRKWGGAEGSDEHASTLSEVRGSTDRKACMVGLPVRADAEGQLHVGILDLVQSLVPMPLIVRRVTDTELISDSPSGRAAADQDRPSEAGTPPVACAFDVVHNADALPWRAAVSHLVGALIAEKHVDAAMALYNEMRSSGTECMLGCAISESLMFDNLISGNCRQGNVQAALDIFDDWKAARDELQRRRSLLPLSAVQRAQLGSHPYLSNSTLAFLEACCHAKQEQDSDFKWRVYDVCAFMRQQEELRKNSTLPQPEKGSHHVGPVRVEEEEESDYEPDVDDGLW